MQNAVVHLVGNATRARRVIPAFRLVAHLCGDRLEDVVEDVVGVRAHVAPRCAVGRDDEASLLGRHGPSLGGRQGEFGKA